ncbi:MAG: diacylglycerol/polyprenol kinase family protein [Candidatus Nanoarchaeia archaeon]
MIKLKSVTNKIKLKSVANKIRHEIHRKAAHITGLLAILALILLNESVAMKILALLLVFSIFGNWYFSRKELRIQTYEGALKSIGLPDEVAERKAKRLDKKILAILYSFARANEKEPFQASIKAILSLLIILILFGSPFAIFGGLAVAFGDSAASLIGKKFGKIKIIFNRKKSLEGTVAFFSACTLAILAYLWLFPKYAFINPFLLAPLISVIGAFTETIPYLDDNFSVPIIVGFVTWSLAIYV